MELRALSNPMVYEINTWAWLAELSRREHRRVDLGSVPEHEWDRIAGQGFDAVWLMGVWQRSPVGVMIALSNTDLTAQFDEALPDWRSEDVVGSPYCVRDYVVDDHLGGREGLALARETLADRHVGLILDFVPNHIAPDHPWTVARPEVCVTGTDEQLARDPKSFVRIAGRVFANGRDPYFPAWPDVVQINAFAPELRSATVQTLGLIADQCDGVRCDMAMLVMNDIFSRTWGTRVGDPPADDFWPHVINEVRAHHPGFLFIAEAYWDLEWALQQQGFDYCYDKRLYDRVLHGTAEQTRLHLLADLAYQQRLVRFTENHDEQRAAKAFGQRAPVAAVTALTQTGLRLVHHGQLTGATVHLPVFLGRRPDQPVDQSATVFYGDLLAVLADPALRSGIWQLCERSGWDDNESHRGVLAWTWTGAQRWLIVVNLDDETAAAMISTPWTELNGASCLLTDPTHHVTYNRSGDDLANGLFVELAGGDWHVFRVDLLDDASHRHPGVPQVVRL